MKTVEAMTEIVQSAPPEIPPEFPFPPPETIPAPVVSVPMVYVESPAQWDYRTFSDKGIWTELGQGCVDFPAVFQILENAGFSGWIIVETDVTQLPTALESAIISRAYLRRLGV